jgi:hypothetical protein
MAGVSPAIIVGQKLENVGLAQAIRRLDGDERGKTVIRGCVQNPGRFRVPWPNQVPGRNTTHV